VTDPATTAEGALIAAIEALPAYEDHDSTLGLDIYDPTAVRRADVLAAIRAAGAISLALPRGVAEAIGGSWTHREADGIARAYAAGHRDGLWCGMEAGAFGFTECEHVGHFAAR
jgi:hypothetical protein